MYLSFTVDALRTSFGYSSTFIGCPQNPPQLARRRFLLKAIEPVECGVINSDNTRGIQI